MPIPPAGAIRVGLALSLLSATPALRAQTVTLPAGNAPGGAIGYGGVGAPFTAVDMAHPLPVAGRQEAVALVVANLPTPPATLYGGDYIFSQNCATYGSVALRVRGPDGATMQPIVTRTAADATGGTGVTLASGAVVDATATDATGCNANLARVP